MIPSFSALRSHHIFPNKNRDNHVGVSGNKKRATPYVVPLRDKRTGETLSPEKLLLCEAVATSATFTVRKPKIAWGPYSCHLCCLTDLDESVLQENEYAHWKTNRHRQHVDSSSHCIYDYLGHPAACEPEIRQSESAAFDEGLYKAHGIWRNRFVGWKARTAEGDYDSYRQYEVPRRDANTGQVIGIDLLRSEAERTTAPFHCHYCDVFVFDGPGVEEHWNSKWHKKKLYKLGRGLESWEDTPTDSTAGSSNEMSSAEADFIRRAARPGATATTPTFPTSLPSSLEFLRSGPDVMNLPPAKREQVQQLMDIMPKLSDLRLSSPTHYFCLMNLNVPDGTAAAYRKWPRCLPGDLLAFVWGDGEDGGDGGAEKETNGETNDGRRAEFDDDSDLDEMCRCVRNSKHGTENVSQENAMLVVSRQTGFSLSDLRTRRQAVPAVFVTHLLKQFPDLLTHLQQCRDEANFWEKHRDDGRFLERLVNDGRAAPKSCIPNRPSVELLHLAIVSLRVDLVGAMLGDRHRDRRFAVTDRARDGKDAWTRAHYWFDDARHWGWLLDERDREKLEKIRSLVDRASREAQGSSDAKRRKVENRSV